MKQSAIVVVAVALVLIVGHPSYAVSLRFSTGSGSLSWTISQTEDDHFTLVFKNLVIDSGQPDDSAIVGDELILPDMKLTVVADDGHGRITALLEPGDGKIRIRDDSSLGDVLVAEITQGVMVSLWEDLIGYAVGLRDISEITVLAPGYSATIDALAAAANNGLDIDLSFGGSSAVSLYPLLQGRTNGPVQGVISGHIQAIPEPATVLLLSIGLALTRRSRRADAV